jgi:hypothetical protein
LPSIHETLVSIPRREGRKKERKNERKREKERERKKLQG